MAEGKNKILVYADWINIFDSLTDDEAGRLIKHFFKYVNDQNPQSDRLTELLFVPIKTTLKRDLDTYLKTCGKNAENGKLGGRPKKTQNNPNKANGFSNNPTKAKKADTDSDTDTDKEIKIEERKQKFALMLKPFVEKYGREFIKDFYLYWSEETQDHKHLKYELEKTWSLERRLSTWATNAKKYGTILPKQTSEEWKPSWL
jgi:hypothetical protein